MPKTAVRIYYAHDDEEVFEDSKKDYDLEDFGGVLPAVGDRIVSPWVIGNLDRRDPANRDVYEVIHRYFQPVDSSEEDLIYIELVVRVLKATTEEADIATRL